MENILAFGSFLLLCAAWIIAPGTPKQKPIPVPAYVQQPAVS